MKIPEVRVYAVQEYGFQRKASITWLWVMEQHLPRK